MYYSHFGLKEPPFKITPNTDFFFSGGNRGAVLDALVYAITNGEGIIKVVGEVGSGKTMLCRMLQTILPEKIESIYFANPSLGPQDVLHAIAFELQLELPRILSRLKVMQHIQGHLLNRHAEGRQVVIFVEEAQAMPLATLEEIRLLSNLETKQDKLLQIVLFGQPELDVNLNQTHIRQLRERITHSFHLVPMQTDDIRDYLIFRLRAAGYFGPHLFTDAAIKKLSEASQGLVRRVNILADKCLLAAFADNMYQVMPKHVQAAIQDSEFDNKPTHYKKYFILALFFVSLLIATLVFIWWQDHHKINNPVFNKVVTTINSAIVKPRVTATAPPETRTSPLPVKNSVVAVTNENNAQSAYIESLPPKHNAVSALVNEPNVKVNESPTEAIRKPISTVEITQALPIQLPAKTTLPVAPTSSTKPEAVKVAIKPIDEKQLLVERRLEVTKSWLFSEQPTTITLQIKSLPTGEKLKDELLKIELDSISQTLDVDKLYLYQKNKNGQTYTVILFGAYARRSEALAALKTLPTFIKNNRPYLRTISGINKDIEQSR